MAPHVKNEKGRSSDLIAKNRRAQFDYDIEERYEAGIVLVGSEVKSLLNGKVDLVDAYASVTAGEMWLKQLNIGPFEQAKAFPHEPKRPRKLLLHASEIAQIDKALSRQGYTLIPLQLYFKGGRVKVELGLGRGKNTVDKRATIARKTADREARVEMVRHSKRGRE